jgi:hypothetical protein
MKKQNKRQWGYDEAGEPWLGDDLHKESPSTKTEERRIFSKVIYEDQGRLRIALENPPVYSFDKLQDEKYVDTTDVAHWRKTTVATVCNHVKAGLLKPYKPKKGTIRGYLFQVREVKRWMNSVSIGRWSNKRDSKR